MKSKVEKNADLTKLTLDGSLTIEHAGRLKELFSQALFESAAAQVCLEKITAIDLSGIQILCAANNSFEKNKKILTRKNHNNDVVRQALLGAGFDSPGSCPENLCENCFWKGDFE